MNNIKILIFLLNNKEKKFTINQISKVLDINYRIAHTQVKLLEKENLIKTEIAGNSLLCSLTNVFNDKIFVAEYYRKQKILNKDFKIIVKRFEEAKQNYILLLFGSYAKNTHNKHSDIDLLSITEDEKEIHDIAGLLPQKIHLTTITIKQFLAMKNSKELTVVSEAISNNIILIGIENYYRLLNDN